MAELEGFWLLITVAVVYTLPSIIAAARKHPSRHTIAIVNLCWGWTLLGWLIAFFWSLQKIETPDEKRESIRKAMLQQIEENKIYEEVEEELLEEFKKQKVAEAIAKTGLPPKDIEATLALLHEFDGLRKKHLTEGMTYEDAQLHAAAEISKIEVYQRVLRDISALDLEKVVKSAQR